MGPKANLKAVQGDLSMLDKFIFVSKQPVLIEISDIHQVIFSHIRASIATACMFNMQIVMKHSVLHADFAYCADRLISCGVIIYTMTSTSPCAGYLLLSF